MPLSVMHGGSSMVHLPLHADTQGHKNAVLEVHWLPSGEQIVTCSADQTVRGWDASSGQQIKKYKEHAAVVNSVCPMHRGPPLLVSASDDCCAKLWDMRSKKSTATVSLHLLCHLPATVQASAAEPQHNLPMPSGISITGQLHGAPHP